MKLFTQAIAFALTVLFCAYGYSGVLEEKKPDSSGVIELAWDDLVPETFDPETVFQRNGVSMKDVDKIKDDSELASKILAEIMAEYEKVGLVKELDGKRISLTGFAVPLEFTQDGKRVTEMLFVPYKGACIHLPPPPMQQIIYLKSKDGFPSRFIIYPLIVKGILHTESVESRYARAGYVMDAFYMNYVR